MVFWKLFLTIGILTPLFLANLAVAGPQAELVILNAKIWTGVEATKDAEAVALWHGRILDVGSNDSIRSLIGTKTQVIDAQGRRVVPGFHDSHLHLLGGGQQLSRVELKDAESEAEFGRRLQEFDKRMPRDRWMLGGNWDHDRTFRGELPTAALVDKYVKNRPVFIRRYDGHMALANTLALQMANISAKSQDPAGGVIYRSQDGRTPSGILKDNAMDLVERLIPEPSEEEILEAVRAALRALAENGITSVQDMDGSTLATRRTLLKVYQRLAVANELTCRVELRWPIAAWKELASLGIEARFGNAFVRIGGLKGYMDGSLGSSTAKMFEPYVGETNNTGVFVTPPAEMLAMIRAADAAGLSVAIHAIGDEANSRLLDIFAEVSQVNGPRDRRFRIEHAQHLRPADIPRFGKQNVIASMQPYHVVDDGRWAEGRIGRERCASSYAFRSLSKSGAILAFGSDWPVAPLSPMLGIDAAVNRQTLDGKHPEGWFPDEKIDVSTALKAYTAGSAFAAGQEHHLGKIAAGQIADLVILDADLLDPAQRTAIGKTTVNTTIVNGRVVSQR